MFDRQVQRHMHVTHARKCLAMHGHTYQCMYVCLCLLYLTWENFGEEKLANLAFKSYSPTIFLDN